MIIECPSCEKRYQADEKSLSPQGRKVRCASCGNVWFQSLAEESTLSAAEDFDSLIDNDTGTEEPERRSTFRFAKVASWALFLFVVSLTAFAGYQYRTQIVGFWPNAATAYKWIGLEPNVMGIVFQDIEYERRFDDGLPLLSVRGKVINLTDRSVSVPQIRLTLLDQGGSELYQWTEDVGVDQLEPRGELKMSARLASPPIDARELVVEFEQDDPTVPNLGH